MRQKDKNDVMFQILQNLAVTEISAHCDGACVAGDLTHV